MSDLEKGGVNNGGGKTSDLRSDVSDVRSREKRERKGSLWLQPAIRGESGPIPVARGGCGAEAHPPATRPVAGHLAENALQR